MQRGFLPGMPLFLRPEFHEGATEYVILTAAEHDAREAVIQAARWWKENPKWQNRESLQDALDALEETT